MRKVTITLLLSVISFFTSLAQEVVIPNVNQDKFTGLIFGGEMEQAIYLPYFKKNADGKKNFRITRIAQNSLMEEQQTDLEIPDSYQYKALGYGGNARILFFYDADKKQDVIITVQDNNTSKKKTLKSTGNTYIPINSNNPEGLTFLTVSNKGNYKVEMVDVDLETKWEQTFNAPSGTSWDIIHVKSRMEGIEILRKENKSDGHYGFVLHTINGMDGKTISENKIEAEGMHPYPTFFSSKEGMSFTGGYYYSSGKYSDKPDGVFFAMITPEGSLEEVCKVPFSQVIEDVKNSIGSKLTDNNSTIVFTAGYLSHETESYIMVGQLISRKNTENSCSITTGGMVTVKFDMERKYTYATSSKVKNQIFELNNNTESTNIVDLGVWLQNAGLLQFKQFMNMPGNPMIEYQTKNENDIIQLCFKTIGLKADTARQECMDISRMPHKSGVYTFNGIKAPRYPIHKSDVIISPMEIEKVLFYELHPDGLFLFKQPLPPLEDITIEFVPEEPVEDMPEDSNEETKQE